MDLFDAPPGLAFDGDYPELSDAALGEAVRRQLDELARTGTDNRRAGILDILRGRRCGRLELPQLDFLPRKDGSDAVVAYGEIVMRAAAYDGVDVRKTLTDRGFQPHPRTGVGPAGFIRLRNPTMPLTKVEDALAHCGGRGAAASTNYLAVLAAVGKGIGGPEPAPALPPLARHGAQPAGRPVTVAVIDTGIPRDRRGDGWLAAVPRTRDNLDLLDALPCGPDGYLDFQSGHGTFVAGIVQRVAPGARITVYRAADTDGFASDDAIGDAMVQAFDDGAEIINLSLGGATVDDERPPVMAAAVEHIRQRSRGEVVIVAAAGNSGDEVPLWPAALEGVEAVAGLTADLTGSAWSSRGSHVRFSTVAEGIRSTFVTGRESPVFDREPEVFPPDAWAVWTGTSFAAPQIAGAVARASQELGLSPRGAVDRLAARGLPIAGYGSALRILTGVRPG